MSSRRFKQIIFTLIAIGLLAGLLLPAFMRAADSSTACARLTNISERAESEFSKRESRLENVRQKRDAKLTDRIEQRDDKIQDQRTKFDDNLIEHITKLQKRATTTEQTAAVGEFADTVHEAIAIRRQAVDAARQAFRDGVKKAIADHRSAVDQEITEFKQKVDAAFTKAQADCAAGVEGSTVISDLRTAIKAAKDDLHQDRLGNQRVGPQVVKLVAERRTATEKARADFKATVLAARTKLKDALGVRAG